jgi:hypothetical protein
MCKDCPQYLDHDLEVHIEALKNKMTTHATDAMNYAGYLEKDYRSNAVSYHTSNIECRQQLPEADRARLKRAFEMTTTQEHRAFFAESDRIRSALLAMEKDIRTWFVQHESGSLGTPAEVLHHGLFVLSPRVKALQAECEKHNGETLRLQFALSRLVHLMAERASWTVVARREVLFGMDALQGEEFRIYLAWVRSLPETIRMLQLNPRPSLNKIAIDMMFHQPEGVDEDGTEEDEDDEDEDEDEENENQEHRHPPRCTPM